MIHKLLEGGHKLDSAVCWSVSAKNALANVKGFSPNQLLIGRNPNFPSILTDKLPALEPCRYDDHLYRSLKAMREAREAFIHLDADERLKRAIKRKTRKNISEIPLEIGTKVYFDRQGSIRGPGVIIGHDNKDVLVKQGGTCYKVPPCSIWRENEEFDSSDKVTTVPEQETISDVQASQQRTRSSEQEEQQRTSNTDQERRITRSTKQAEQPKSGSEDQVRRITDTIGVSKQVSELEASERVSGQTAHDVTETEQGLDRNSTEKTHSIQTFTKDTEPPLRGLVECKQSSDSDWQRLRIVSRGGKKGGKNSQWWNVYDADSENSEIFSVNWDDVVEWKSVPEEVCLNTRSCDDPAVLEAKMNELENWKKFKAYEEVIKADQNYLTTQWVITSKYDNAKRVIKARLVARGFQETDEVQKDSPTASRESLRLLLLVSVSLNWKIHSIDVKSAFLQGETLKRTVYLKPPKEANTDKLWILNKCVYGLRDASRLWYLRVNDVLKQLGVVNINLDEAVFIFVYQDRVCGIICLHVDDFLWAGDSVFENKVIMNLMKEFLISKQQTDTFIFLGLQIKQTPGKIVLDQTHYIENIEAPDVSIEGKKKDEPLDDEAKKSLKCFTGQLAWAANLTRPDISFHTCESSVGSKHSTVLDIFKAHKTLRKLRSTEVKLTFLALKDLTRSCKLVVFSDASHANLKGGASQFGYVVLLVDHTGTTNIIKWVSKKISRVVKSTLAAETLALMEAAQNAFFIKCLLESMLNIGNTYEIFCLCDNQSLVEHVNKSTKTVSDFRLRVDLACLRDMINRNEVTSIKWVNNSLQIADCLTKETASSENLLRVIRTNRLDNEVSNILCLS